MEAEYKRLLKTHKKLSDLHKKVKKRKSKRKIENIIITKITEEIIEKPKSNFRFSCIPKAMTSAKLRKPLLSMKPSSLQNFSTALPNPAKCFVPVWTKNVSSTSVYDTEAQFSLISYNVLAQKHLDSMPHLYRKNKKSALQWKNRYVRFQNFIKSYPCDIYCLQEVQKSYLRDYTDFFEALPKKMLCLYTQRPGGKPDGCMIAYDCEKLDLVERVDVDYSITNPFSKVSDNVGQIAVLSPTENPDNVIIIGNTHLLYNPKNGDIKLHQITMLLHKMQALKKSYEDMEMCVSCLLCGDLNSTEVSGVCQLIQGRLNTEDFTRFNFSRQLQNTRAGIALSEEISGLPMNLREEENSPIFTNKLGLEASVSSDECRKVYTQTAAERGLVVDHVFTSGMQVISKLSMWPRDKYEPEQLPGDTYGSDHMPVGVRFNLIL